MLACLGQAALHTALLAAIVQLGLGLLRVKLPQLRLTAWTVVLAASLAMPALQWATPLQLSVLPDLLPGAALTEAADAQRQTFVSQAAMALSPGDVATPTRVISLLEALYFPIAGILMLRLIVGIALTLRLLAKAAPVYSDWAAGTDIRISNDIAAPVTVAHVVLLPADVVNWPAAMREAVLAHERAHIARWDFALLLASQVNQAIFWFSPLSWWLHRRLAALAEFASDDQAMRATGDRAGYAEVLLEMGRRSGPLLRGLAMARPATLKYRIERIVSDRVPAAAISPLQQMALAVGAASLSVMVASSRQESAPALTSVPSMEQRQPTRSAGLNRSPLPPPGQDGLEPMPIRGRQLENGFQTFPQAVPGVVAARSSTSPAARATVEPTARPTSRSTLSPAPQRAMVQRIRAERDPRARDASLDNGAVVSAGLASRSNDGHDLANSIGAASPIDKAFASHQSDPPPATQSALLKHIDGPYCTGVYTPRSETPRTHGSVDFVEASYLQEQDGTPWLKLYLGSRTRARLTGFDVDRISYRATVVMQLPRAADHVTGTTGGTYGTIDFECTRPDAHL